MSPSMLSFTDERSTWYVRDYSVGHCRCSVVLWLLGWLAFHIGGTFIHILIVVAIIVLLYNLFVGRRRRSL